MHAAVRTLRFVFGFVPALLSVACAEPTYSPTACPELPSYDIALARSYAEAGAPIASSDVPYPWLSADERATLEEAARLGCITLPQRRYRLELEPSAATTSPAPSQTQSAADAGAAADADSL